MIDKRKIVAAAASLAAALTGLAVSAPANASPASGAAGAVGTAASSSSFDAGQVAALGVRFWTPDRLRSAKAVPVPKLTAKQNEALKPFGPQGAAGKVNGAGKIGTTTPKPPSTQFGSTAQDWYGSTTSAPATTSGKVFFTGADGGAYVCSASTVNSGGKTLVMTAGHCVSNGAGRWYNSQPWLYIPGYRDGAEPYGRWYARQLWTRPAWFNGANRAEDIGAALMYTQNGTRIVNRVGGQGIEWNYPLSQYMYQFGYPQRAPFNGQRLKYCSNTTYSDGGHEGINCNMTEGASGGGWLDDFNGSFGWLDTVNSWVFWNGSGVRYKWNGPYFGNNARDFYNTVTAAEV